MQRGSVLPALLLAACCLSEVATATGNTAPVQRFNSMPLAFTQNNGQWDGQALFRASAGGAVFWFTKDKVYYQFTRRISLTPAPLPVGEGWSQTGVREINATSHSRPVSKHGVNSSGNPIGARRCLAQGDSPSRPYDPAGGFDHEDDSIATMVITASFVGANPDPEVVGEDLMEYKCNYFLGNDPTKWRTNVPNYRAVVYRDIYPGIDLKYYGNGDGKIEYDFIVHPGADPSQIAIRYDGAKEVCVNEAGDIEIETELGILTSSRPTVYERGKALDTALNGAYRVRSENVLTFEVVGGRDLSLAMVIDPVLEYSTLFGGHSFENGSDIAVDGSGCCYVTGITFSYNFPVVNALYGTFGYCTFPFCYAAYVTKLSAAGNNLEYSTYFGGTQEVYNVGTGIDVDDSGFVYLTGRASSFDFPIVNPCDLCTSFGFGAFAAKLTPDGDSICFSFFIGEFESHCLTVDKAGSVYIAGQTETTNVPLRGSLDTTYNGGSWDAYVCKLSSDGSELVYGGFLGGSQPDYGNGIAVDQSGCAYVSGYTRSANFPFKNGFDSTLNGRWDAFVTKVSADGGVIEYSTLLGGALDDVAGPITVDRSGCAYVSGYTGSPDFPTFGELDVSHNGYSDAFLSKLSPTGSSLELSCFIGGAANDAGSGVAVDSCGGIFISGATSSTDFPLHHPFDSTYGSGGGGGSQDAFLLKIDSSETFFRFSTFIGGSGWDGTNSMVIDRQANAYVVGPTESADFPAMYTFGEVPTADVFVMKFFDDWEVTCGDADRSDAVDVSDVVYLIAYVFGGGPAPRPLLAGDANCDQAVDVSDAVYLITYVFAGGPAPCAGC